VVEGVKDKIIKKIGKGFDVCTSVLPDENLLSVENCEQVMKQAKEETMVVVCVGGKNANTYGKYVCAKNGWNLIFVNVLPDGDDFANGYAMLWQNGAKQMFAGKAPDVILCDTALAQSFCAGGVGEAFALVLRNIMTVFDNNFSATVQNVKTCNSANYVLTSVIRDCIKLAKKPFSKNTIDELFACLYRISMAKCLSNANIDNFCGMHSLLFTLQSKYPQYSEGVLSCAVSDTLAKIYHTILQSDDFLITNKDCIEHSELIKRYFEIDLDATYQFNTNDEQYKKYKQAFCDNIVLAKKVNNLCRVLVDKKPEWDAEIAKVCLKVSADIYTYNGLLSYANDRGMFDRQYD